jgi:choline dehydrogenase
MAIPQEFDYIIVGAGASGSALAYRLSAEPNNQVLLLEAGGPDLSPDIHTLDGFVRLWGSELDWALTTEPQAGQGGRAIMISQGKVLGGSTSINALMYVRGNRRNFDHWAALGNAGWSYDEILPYFRRSEDFAGAPSPYRGKGGPLSVRANPEPASRSEAFLRAATELGYDGPDCDYNGAQQEHAAGPLQFTIDAQGRRSSAATAFLAPALERPNLSIVTGAMVTRVLIEGGRAVGVAYAQDGQDRQARAGREVIISAGALQSPKLLMLSGIGAAAQLRTLDLPVVVDLPGVGQNLQDHLQLPVAYRARHAAPTPQLLTGNVLFVQTRPDAPAAAPDLQLNFTPAIPQPLAPLLDLGGPACIFLPILVQPRSRGELRLRSADPRAQPLINPNYLSDAADVQVFTAALGLIRALVDTRAFQELGDGELAPGRDTELEPFIRAQTTTLWHPAGTCKMGRDELAVVDPQLRVHGVAGLRVADASVMPSIPSGNTLAACYMIGEKAADFILSQGS